MVLIVLGAILLYAYVGRESSDAHEALPREVAARPSEVIDPTASAVHRIEPPSSSVAQRDDAHDLLFELNHLTDGRAFALKSWMAPERGGRFYAEYVARHCGSLLQLSAIMTTAQASSSLPSESLIPANEKLARAQRLCGQFTEAELAQFSLADRTGREAKAEDAFFKLTASLSAAGGGDPDQRRTAVRNILDNGDALLIDQLGARLYSSSGSFSFQGRGYAGPALDVLMAAIRLAPCDLGLSCGQEDLSLIAPCLATGHCPPSRQAEVEQAFSSDPAKYAQVLKLRDDIVQAIRRRNASAFVP